MRLFSWSIVRRARGSVWIACISAMSALVHSAQAPVTELEGVWDGEYSITSGKRMDLAAGRVQLVFKGNTLLATGLVTPQEREVKFTIDSKATPKRFDYWDANDRPKPCIYELAGGVLRIAAPTGRIRPEAFPEGASDTVVILGLKRRTPR